MNYRDFTLGDWIGHISGAIEDERELDGNEMRDLVEFLSKIPRWRSVSERLPEELEPVNITWINHNPESYYADIKDKPFTATGVYFNGIGGLHYAPIFLQNIAIITMMILK